MYPMKSSRSFLFVSSLLLTGSISGLFANHHENWPTWRPSSGNGVAENATPPVEWGEDKNIKWKTAIAGTGFSTPIVWEDKIFILSAEAVEDAPVEAAAQRRAQPPGGNANAGGSPRGGGQGPGGGRGPGGQGGGAGGPDGPNPELIAEFDKDGDGELSEAERDALRTAMRARRGAGQGGPPQAQAGRGGRGQGQGGAGGGRQRRGGGNATAQVTQVHQFKVIALDRNSGEVIWKKLAVEEKPHEGHHPSHGYADASPVTDGEYLYVSFGSRGIFCYDLDGDLIWKKDLGDLRSRNGFGEAVAPSLAGDKLLVLWDQEDQSMIYGLDKRTGEEMWSKERDERSSWTTPFIQEVNGKLQAIVPGTNATRSYDTETGDIIWEATGLTSNVIPTPVVGHGNVYVTSGYQGNSVQAIKLSSKGDVSDTSDVVWRVRESGSYVASPVLSEKRLYVTKGIDAYLSCMDAMTGDYHYQDKKLDALRGIYGSPLAANGHLYVVGREGTTVVLKDSEAFEIVATNKLDDKIDSSPIALGGNLFLRGHNYLYCISEG
jgi:outer membrane protein assembly factor BamB